MEENRHGPHSVSGCDGTSDFEIPDGNSSGDGDHLDWANTEDKRTEMSSGDSGGGKSGSLSDDDVETESKMSGFSDATEKAVVATESGRTTSDVKEETTSLLLKLCLTAQMTGNEANTSSQMLFTVPNLQLLGMPLNLVPLAPGCVGPTLLLLLPLLGWYSDRGNNPLHRKLAIGILSILLVTSGAVCVVVANVLHIQSYLLIMGQADDPSLSAWPPGITTSHETNSSQDVSLVHKIVQPRIASNLEKNTPQGVQFLPQTATPFKAWLAMTGYVLMDLSFELNNAFVKAWVIMCSSRHEHASHLTLVAFMSSVGGLLTSCVAVADVLSLFQFSDAFDGVNLAVQTILIQTVVVVLNLVGGALTIIVGLRQFSRLNKNKLARTKTGKPEIDEKKVGGEGHARKKLQNNLKTPLLPEEESSSSSLDNSPLAGQIQNYGTRNSETSVGGGSQASSHLEATQTPKEDDSSSGSKGHYKRDLVLIYMSMYFSTAVIMTFCGLMTDYVGKAIYGGDPGAEPGSDSLRNFQTGVWYGSFGFIVYYSGYVTGTLCYKRVRKLLGHRLEYIIVLLLAVVTMVTLALTARLEVFFLACFIAGVQRAAYFNVAFVVLNDTIQAQALRTGKPGSDKLGLAMAVASEMAMLSYSTLYPCTIALEHATGVVSVPLWVCCACASIVMILFLLIKNV